MVETESKNASQEKIKKILERKNSYRSGQHGGIKHLQPNFQTRLDKILMTFYSTNKTEKRCVNLFQQLQDSSQLNSQKQ